MSVPRHHVRRLRAELDALNDSAGTVSDGDLGDITVSGSGTIYTIDAGAVTNAKMANMATSRIKGRVTAGTGATEDLTGTQATTLLDAFTTGLKGLAPASGGGTSNFLRADGTWVTPPGTATSDVPYAYGQLTADYTMTSTVAVQKLFDFSASGALTLATGRYKFSTTFQITGLSATSGNGQFIILGAGTATIDNVMYHVIGQDATFPLTTGIATRSGSVTSTGQADMVTAGAGTALFVTIQGVFNITATGTIIPSIALTTAAAGAVKSGSYFECIRIGDTGSNTQGSWS